MCLFLGEVAGSFQELSSIYENYENVLKNRLVLENFKRLGKDVCDNG